MSDNERLNPTRFGTFLHDAFNLMQEELVQAQTINVYPHPNIFLMYVTVDAMLTSLGEQFPEDPMIVALKKELSGIDDIVGGSLYSFKKMKLDESSVKEVSAVLEKILRALGIIRSGTAEDDDENECQSMEADLK